MTLRTELGLLWALCGLLALATLVAGAGLWVWPLEGIDLGAAPPPSAGASGARTLARPPLSAYAVLWERDLQRPLYDPAPVVAAPAPPPKPPVRLVGTVIEPRLSYALFKDKAGQVKMVGAGRSLEGLEVLAVTADSATVRFGGAEHILKVEKEGQAP